MWISPNHPNPPKSSQEPPEDTGQRLATLARGPGAEMRISLAEYQGRPYVALRVWERGSDGQLWPSRKGGSVRIGEIPDVIAALRQVEDLLAREQAEAPARNAGRAQAPRHDEAPVRGFGGGSGVPYRRQDDQDGRHGTDGASATRRAGATPQRPGGAGGRQAGGGDFDEFG